MLPQGRVYLACSSLGVAKPAKRGGRGGKQSPGHRPNLRPGICAKMALSPALSRPVIKRTMFLLSLRCICTGGQITDARKKLILRAGINGRPNFHPTPREPALLPLRQTNREYCRPDRLFSVTPRTNSTTILAIMMAIIVVVAIGEDSRATFGNDRFIRFVE